MNGVLLKNREMGINYSDQSEENHNIDSNESESVDCHDTEVKTQEKSAEDLNLKLCDAGHSIIDKSIDVSNIVQSSLDQPTSSSSNEINIDNCDIDTKSCKDPENLKSQPGSYVLKHQNFDNVNLNDKESPNSQITDINVSNQNVENNTFNPIKATVNNKNTTGDFKLCIENHVIITQNIECENAKNLNVNTENLIEQTKDINIPAKEVADNQSITDINVENQKAECRKVLDDLSHLVVKTEYNVNSTDQSTENQILETNDVNFKNTESQNVKIEIQTNEVNKCLEHSESQSTTNKNICDTVKCSEIVNDIPHATVKCQDVSSISLIDQDRESLSVKISSTTCENISIENLARQTTLIDKTVNENFKSQSVITKDLAESTECSKIDNNLTQEIGKNQNINSINLIDLGTEDHSVEMLNINCKNVKNQDIEIESCTEKTEGIDILLNKNSVNQNNIIENQSCQNAKYFETVNSLVDEVVKNQNISNVKLMDQDVKSNLIETNTINCSHTQNDEIKIKNLTEDIKKHEFLNEDLKSSRMIFNNQNDQNVEHPKIYNNLASPVIKSHNLSSVNTSDINLEQNVKNIKLTNDCQTDSAERANDRESSVESVAKSDLSLADPELINVDEIELSDEDTWLYKSPKQLSVEEEELSPYKWLRKDVEDPDNVKLQMVKTALVSKLNELTILNIVNAAQKIESEKETAQEINENCDSFNNPLEAEPEKILCHINENCDNFFKPLSPTEENAQESHNNISSNNVNKCCESEQKNLIELSTPNVVDTEEKIQLPANPPLNDIMDVHAIAKLQEEKLKQSSSNFFYDSAKTFPRSCRLPPSESSSNHNKKLLKPMSVEALHMCNDKQNVPVVCPNFLAGPKVSSPIRSPYGSSISLSSITDAHRSSLPNLNRGYNSLKSKKSRRPNETVMQCQLPVYPLYPRNESQEAVQEAAYRPFPNGTTRASFPSYYRESQTLPPSYKVKNKNVPNYNRQFSSNQSLRRESVPPPSCQRNILLGNSSRRESAPSIPDYADDQRKQKTVSPQSQKKNLILNQFQHYRGSTPALHNSSRTPSLNHLNYQTKESPPSSHSPTKRQPLSMMHNWSPKSENCQHHDDIKKSSIPSRIPSPASRSGIPVPSSQCMTPNSAMGDTWSRDFY